MWNVGIIAVIVIGGGAHHGKWFNLLSSEPEERKNYVSRQYITVSTKFLISITERFEILSGPL